MKARIIVAILLFIAGASHGQRQISIEGIKSIDALGSDGVHLYLSSNGAVYKYDPVTFEELNTFSDQRVLKYDYLDCSQPLRIFVFSEYEQQYILLDQFLNPSGGKRLIDLDIPYSQLATPSSDGNLWVLDQTTQTIKKVDPLRNLEYLSVPFERFYRGKTSSLKLMREASNRVYILAEEEGILQLDIYGNYLGKVSQEKAGWFELSKSTIYFSREMTLTILDSETNSKKILPLSVRPIQFTIIKDKVILTDGKDLYELILD